MSQSGTVTFLFTDLVNSTEHLQAVGDEAGNQLFRVHHKLLTDAVTAAGGQELQWLGDGVLAVFSSAAEAVRCAIQVQQTARRPAANARFAIRIGIHAGDAMRREGGYFGTPVVAARRLCDTAKAGQILCSRLIAELLSGRNAFDLRDAGVVDLKGLTQPIAICEVAYEHNDPAALLRKTPFVGRARQLKRLAAKLEIASAGRGAVVMLLGEPGIGKTRMLEEFSDLARQRDVMVLRGSCYDGEFQPPFGPFAEAIVEYAQRAAAEELKEVLGDRAATIARIAPAVRRHLGQIGEPPALDKDEERFRLLDAMTQSLIALSRMTPLVLIADDLHWADKGAVAMLSHIGHFVPNHPILLVGAYRDAEVGRHHPLARALAGISRSRDFESIPLKGLDGSELAELLGIIGDQVAPEQLVATLREETNGNPFFIREVLLNLMEEGKIFRDGEAWNKSIGVNVLGIPEGVREVIARRILRLSDDTRRLLTVGAAFQGAFSFDVAAEVAGLDEATALSAADEALDAQLLRSGVSVDSLDFTHALIRHTLYAELSPPRRIRLHRQIAEAMERQWGDRASEHAAEVAYQFWRGAGAAGTPKGADYAIAAAENAEKAFAHDDVVAFLRIAIELLPNTDPRVSELKARLGLALTWALDPQEATKVSKEAAALIAVEQSDRAAAVFYEKVARAMFSAGQLQGAWEMARCGLKLAEDRRDVLWASLEELDLLREEAEDASGPGIRLDSPRQRALRTALLGMSHDELKVHQIDPQFHSRAEIINDPAATPHALLNLAGELQRSLLLWEEEAGDAERKGRTIWAMGAWANAARCHNAMGNFPAAQAALDRAAGLSTRSTGQPVQLMFLYVAKHEMLLATDDGWDEMRTDQGASALLNRPMLEARWAFAAVCSTGAYVAARSGRPQAAMQLLDMLPSALQSGAPWFSAYGVMTCTAASTLWLMKSTSHAALIERCLREKLLPLDYRSPMRDGRLSVARLCALQGRYDEAREWFAAARTALEEQGARPLRAIADYDEALMHLRRGLPGDPEVATPLLRDASAQFIALGMTGWTQRAQQALHTGSEPSL
ncbi:MAG: ATP-binding protein [Candidatus Binataceae bacterium]